MKYLVEGNSAEQTAYDSADDGTTASALAAISWARISQRVFMRQHILGRSDIVAWGA